MAASTQERDMCLMADRQSRELPTLSPQLSFLEGPLVPNPHSLLPPRLYLRSQTSPAPGPAGDEETGSSRDSAGGRTGRPETKPEPSWVLARVPVCSLLGGGQIAGAQRGTGLGQGPLLLQVQSQLTDAKVLFAQCQE